MFTLLIPLKDDNLKNLALFIKNEKRIIDFIQKVYHHNNKFLNQFMQNFLCFLSC